MLPASCFPIFLRNPFPGSNPGLGTNVKGYINKLGEFGFVDAYDSFYSYHVPSLGLKVLL